MIFKTQKLDVETQNNLVIIARKLQPVANAIKEVAGKAPSMEQLVNLAYARFNITRVLKDVLTELNPEVMRPVPQYSSQPKSDKTIQMEAMQGKVLAASNRVLSNHPPKKYRALILKRLKVDKDGDVKVKS